MVEGVEVLLEGIVRLFLLTFLQFQELLPLLVPQLIEDLRGGIVVLQIEFRQRSLLASLLLLVALNLLGPLCKALVDLCRVEAILLSPCGDGRVQIRPLRGGIGLRQFPFQLTNLAGLLFGLQIEPVQNGLDLGGSLEQQRRAFGQKRDLDDVGKRLQLSVVWLINHQSTGAADLDAQITARGRLARNLKNGLAVAIARLERGGNRPGTAYICELGHRVLHRRNRIAVRIDHRYGHLEWRSRRRGP